MGGGERAKAGLRGDGPATRAAREQYEAREAIDRALEAGADLATDARDSLLRLLNYLAPGGAPEGEGTGEVDLVTSQARRARDELGRLVEVLPEPVAIQLRAAVPHVDRALEIRRSVTGRAR